VGETGRADDETTTALISLSLSCSDGLRIFHLGCTSISSQSLIDILAGLGPTCSLEELKINSNRMGTEGTAALVAFLNSKSPENGNQPVLPKLNRIDVSYNTLGDLGTTILIRAISKRAKVNVTEASLSGNDIGSSCIERIMNIFLCHKLITLNLDNNCIGD
jgi:Ran GTPase-activating protein (RanGAP) involved in mRNA processing and transport